jgi:hypothetical protein
VQVALVTILAAFAAGGGPGALPAAAYLYEQSVQVDRPVRNLRCTELQLPKAIRIEWDYTPLGGVANPTYEVKRDSTVLGDSTAKSFTDTFAWSSGQQYTYSVRVKTDSAPTMNLPAPPMGANPADIYNRSIASGNPWVSIQVTPFELAATEAQTADSRLDLRYGNPTYLDFPFGSFVYRGGLFAGYAADPSRVGRSYARFTLPSLASGASLWCASFHAYHTRSAATGTATIGCHSISPAWTAATLKWSNAPSLTPGSPLATTAIAWDANNPVSSWQRWAVAGAVGPCFYSGGLFGAGLAATDETANAWAYFAKSEYDSSLGPRLLYAVGDTCEELSVTLSPTSVTGGTSATGTVTLTAAAPSGGKTVSLGSSNGTIAAVPASVNIAAGARTATFTITTTSPMSPTAVIITATLGSDSETGVLTVNP